MKNHVTKTKRQKSETLKRMNLFGESCVLWSEKSPPLLFCVKQLGRWWNELAEVRFLNSFC